MSQGTNLTKDDYLKMMRSPIQIAGVEVFFAEPTVARMDGLNALVGLGFDIWEKNPAADAAVNKLMLVRFGGDNEKVAELCRLCLSSVPDGLDVDKITGLECGALLQGFFIYYHVRAGTIDLSLKLLLPQMGPAESARSTSPTPKKISGKSGRKSSECSA